jgi:hypothetical protein
MIVGRRSAMRSAAGSTSPLRGVARTPSAAPTVEPMMRLMPHSALIAAYLAAVLSFASAAVTAYWLLGGTALLSTVGGELERFARNRSIAAVAVAVGVVVAKVVGGVLALVLTRRPSRRLARLRQQLGRCWRFTALCSPSSARSPCSACSARRRRQMSTRAALARCLLGPMVSGVGARLGRRGHRCPRGDVRRRGTQRSPPSGHKRPRIRMPSGTAERLSAGGRSMR